MVYVIGLVVYVVSSFLGAGQALHELLIPLGFSSDRYLLFGSRYEGKIRDRPMDVYFTPARMLRPSLMEAHVDVPSRSRMAIAHQTPLLDCSGCLPVNVEGSEASRWQIRAQDEGWARRLLSEPRARRALANLMDGPETLGLREIYVQPKRIWFRAHVPQGASVPRQWFDDLVALGEAVEFVP